MQRLVMGLLALLSLGVSAEAQQRKDLPSLPSTMEPDQLPAVMPLHMTVEPVGQCWKHTGGNAMFYGEVPAHNYIFVRMRTFLPALNPVSLKPAPLILPADPEFSFTTPSGDPIGRRGVLVDMEGNSGISLVRDGTGTTFNANELYNNWDTDRGWQIFMVMEPVIYHLKYDQFLSHVENGLAEFCVRDVPSLRGTVPPDTAWSDMGWKIYGAHLQ